MNKQFRFNKEQARNMMIELFPKKENRLNIEKVLGQIAEQSANINNANWNINLTKTFIRFNCGNRYILNIKPHRIRVMCEQTEFLKLSKKFINEFLSSHLLYCEDSKGLQKILSPRNYNELIAIPPKDLWHNSVQFEIPIDEWVNKYSELFMPSILIFAQHAIEQSSIMTQMTTAHSPAIIELINSDLDVNLNQPFYANTMKESKEKTQFTWIPFYKEMATTLLTYKNKRTDLLGILYSSLQRCNLSATMYVDNGPNEETAPLKNIDPFTFIGSFNRGNKWHDRVQLANTIAESLGMKLRLSDDEDFKSIPILNSQHSTLFYKNCAQEDYDKLWTLFEEAHRYTQENQKDFAKAFDAALTVKGTAQKNASMVSYWVNPYNILAVDENNVELLNKYGIKVPHQLTGKAYLEILNKITSMIEHNEIQEKSIPEFSYAAWLADKDTFWACGFNFSSINNQLDRFIQNSIWEGRFNKDKDKKQIENAQKVRSGNVLILKTAYTKGEKHTIPVTKIYAVGVVTAITEPKDIEDNYWSFTFNVDYKLVDPPHEIENFSSYRNTISLVKNDELKTFAKSILGDARMANEESGLIKEYTSLLKSNHNVILHGAPGTGKTYLAKSIARLMGCTDAEIGFVQFHPSYDYTDFVEGLRPKNCDDGNSIGFERKDGVFKEFCEKAAKNLVDSKKSLETIQNEQTWQERFDSFINDAIANPEFTLKTKTGNEFRIEDRTAEKIIISIPQNEKVNILSITISEIMDLLTNEIQLDSVSDVKNHFNRKWNTQNDSYTFVIAKKVLKTKKDIPNEPINTISKKNFVFIIDEINRGEINKIFGELFFSIDPGYRGTKGLVQTQYQNLVDGGEFINGFYVPENVYIIGTMNDIDRSVESMDFAMRRRFIFKEITAADSANNMELSDEAKRRMTNLNNAISEIEGLNASYHIGGAYFLKKTEVDGEQKTRSVEASDFVELWNFKLEPLLKEYLRGMEDAAAKLEVLQKAYDKKENDGE